VGELSNADVTKKSLECESHVRARIAIYFSEVPSPSEFPGD